MLEAKGEGATGTVSDRGMDGCRNGEIRGQY
jgi:hypothetical protein